MQPEDDLNLVNQALQGDSLAFELLAERYYPRVYRICLGVLGNPQDSEDCVQDTFLKVYRSLSTFGERASFYTWLYRIAMNTCYDYVRKNRSGSLVSIEAALDEDSPSPAIQLADGNPLPDDQLETKVSVDEIRSCILRLPEKQARILWLRDIEGLSYTQIASIEKTGEGTVKSRLFRARVQLGRLLSGRELF